MTAHFSISYRVSLSIQLSGPLSGCKALVFSLWKRVNPESHQHCPGSLVQMGASRRPIK